jgi:hypothetical protein
MWAGGWLGLLLVPMFAATCVAAVRRTKPMFLLYAAPTVLMLGLHAALASHYTRYNLVLIGPFSAGAAWLLVSIGAGGRTRWRAPFAGLALGTSANLELAATDTETRPGIRP